MFIGTFLLDKARLMFRQNTEEVPAVDLLLKGMDTTLGQGIEDCMHFLHLESEIAMAGDNARSGTCITVPREVFLKKVFAPMMNTFIPFGVLLLRKTVITFTFI